MTDNSICPGCRRHCDLREPHCERGTLYRWAGTQSEGQHSIERNLSLDTNDRLIDGLRDLGRLMRTQYEGKASQKRILIILNETGPITQRDLTKRLGIQPGSASEILAKLEHANLIYRTQNAGDRRTVDIRLTDFGRMLAADAASQRRSRHEGMFSCLSEEEKRILLSLLEKVRADWCTRYPENQKLRGHGGRHRHHGRRGGRICPLEE